VQCHKRLISSFTAAVNTWISCASTPSWSFKRKHQPRISTAGSCNCCCPL